MKARMQQPQAILTRGRWLLCGILLFAGCDMGTGQSANRYEQLNIETKKLTDVLEKISDEASAQAHQAELEEVANSVRDVQQRIAAAAEKNAKKGGGGMGNIANHHQATLWQQTGDAARQQVERIREVDAKAGVIVDKAVEGIEFPLPAMGPF